jgi:predicted nucleic acid-binding protein
MPDATRRGRMESWLERHLALLFEGRVLPITQKIASRWGRLDGMRNSVGRTLAVPDGMIAATALEHDLVLITRNTKDYANLGVALINPWLEP